ncbi:MAG: hypothetical protein BGO49_17515 [Planctomycetales bacterium 71-10]|nr:MAG: hypothetical protein BGO49_17515 [Planctomycetales bacterium 71-10]
MIGDGVAGPRADDEAEAVGLDDRLRGILGMPSDDPKRTWGERVAEALVAAAARGDARSWSVLFRRAGTGVAADSSGMIVDDETASRILEAARGRVDDRSLD